MKAVADGLMDPDEVFQEQMNHCLGCRACEPACPADVKYGQLIEQARDAIEDHAEHSAPVKGLRNMMFKHVFPKQSSMKWMGGALGLYQKSGLQRIARGTGIMRLFPEHLREMEAILPEATSKGVIERIGTYYPAKGKAIARVALFRGCIMDVMFAGTNVNTVKLLSQSGFDVVIPKEQACCGALHAHSGEMDQARAMARTNIDAFQAAGIDYIATNAGGCGALLIEYDHLLHEDNEYREKAAWFAERVIDVSKLIVEQGRVPEFAERDNNIQEHRITYQDSCHLRNVMKSSSAPRQLMKQVEGATFVEMKDSDRCCGSAGIYNVTQPEMAGQLLEHKMEHAAKTSASYMLTSNPGCLLQMKLGIEKHKPPFKMEAMHIVDYLYERLTEDDSDSE